MLLYGGDRHRHEKIEVIPVLDWLRSLTKGCQSGEVRLGTE